jgi:MarR family 2-MHQ and catechol resistance regulon transcriptional repressor
VDTGDFAPALKLWVVLARAHQAVQEQAATNIAAHGLTAAEFGVLEALFHKGPTLLGELQRKILISSGGVTYVVDRLEAKGLVERRPHPADRRARFAALTGEGRKLMRRIFPAHAAHLERVLSGLSVSEQRQATELLKRLGRRAAELEVEEE